MFTIEMMPAAHGDCLWIEYGDQTRHRVLIDGGPPASYPELFARIKSLPVVERVFELFVITHIDADHIGGAIRLMRDAVNLGCEFKRIWFNGWYELESDELVPQDLGAAQGEYLALVIADYEAAVGGPPRHNYQFPATVRLDDDGAPRTLELDGDLEITVLSPGVEELKELKVHWDDVVDRAGVGSSGASELLFRERMESNRQLRPLSVEDAAVFLGADDTEADAVVYGDDDSVANGSSIGLLLEHPDGSALLVGDAYADVLTRSIQAVLADRPGSRLQVDAFKLPHHGSTANLSPELLQSISVRQYLISTSGAMFGHPAPAAVELVLAEHDVSVGPAELIFNYRSPSTAQWATRAARSAARDDNDGVPPYIARYEPGTYWWSSDPR